LLGDSLSVYFDPFDVNLDDDWELGACGASSTRRHEALELTLGRVEPSLFDWMDRQKSGAAPARISRTSATCHHPPAGDHAAGNGTPSPSRNVHVADAAAPAGAGYSARRSLAGKATRPSCPLEP
jgi:hypothetical protein